MEFEEFDLKRSDKNKTNNAKQYPDLEPIFEDDVIKQRSDHKTKLSEPNINEQKLKKWVAIGFIFSLIILGALFFILKGGAKSEMFDAANKTKVEVMSEFKNTFNKDLTDSNFVYEDGGLRSKENTVFKQNPSYGTKFDPNQDVSEFVFTINKKDGESQNQLDDDKNTESKKTLVPTKSTFVVENFMFKPFSKAKEKLAQLNAKYSLEFKLTNEDRLEGFVSNQNYLEKTVLKLDKNKLVLTIFTKDPKNGPKNYSTGANTQTHTNFDENDPSNPNIAKDKAIIWSWKQGDKVDFRSYTGDVPLVCYERVCYYDGTGHPTEKTIKEQLGQ